MHHQIPGKSYFEAQRISRTRLWWHHGAQLNDTEKEKMFHDSLSKQMHISHRCHRFKGKCQTVKHIVYELGTLNYDRTRCTTKYREDSDSDPCLHTMHRGELPCLLDGPQKAVSLAAVLAILDDEDMVEDGLDEE